VYMLKFKSSAERFLFWLQEAKQERDEETCKKVNELLNNPPTARPSGRASQQQQGRAGQLSALQSALGSSADDIGALSGMDQNQIMQLFSLMNSGGGGSGGALSPDALMSQLSFGSGAETGEAGKRPAGKTPQKPGSKGAFDALMLSNIIDSLPAKRSAVELSSLLSRANVQQVVVENAERLAPHLPDQKDQEGSQELAETVGSPQFQQAADFLGVALQSGEMAPALSHFGIREEAVKAAAGGDMLEFAKKLTAQEREALDEQGVVHETNEAVVSKAMETDSNESPPKKQKRRDDDNMELD